MKSAPAIMHTHEARATFSQRLQLAGGEDGLHVRGAAGAAIGLHLVVQRAPVVQQRLAAADDDVDLAWRRPPPTARSRAACLQRRQAGRESRSTPPPPACRPGRRSAPPRPPSRDRRRPRRRAARSRPARPAGRRAPGAAPWRTGAARGPACRRPPAWSGRCTAPPCSSHAAWKAFFTPRRADSVCTRRRTAGALTRTAATRSRSNVVPGLRGGPALGLPMLIRSLLPGPRALRGR